MGFASMAARRAPFCGSPMLLALGLAVALLLVPSSKAFAMKIQEVTSPGGIRAWLVEEHGVPLVAMRFGFDGGSAQDPSGKEGVANFLGGMMDEGAGDLTSRQFQERMQELAMHMGFDDTRDAFYGSFETLTENRDQSAALLALAINKPRFDADAVERVRGQLLAILASGARDPNHVAAEQWSALAFPGHVYGRPANGTPESLQRITGADLAAYKNAIFAKDTLRVVVVGDMDPKTLGTMLDTVFGALPAKARLTPVPDTQPMAVAEKVIDMGVPQSVAQFGVGAMQRKDKDFVPAFVLANIVGGGSMSSRLWEEVREKRGLAYSVYAGLQPFRHASIFAGGVATKNEEIGRSLEVIRAELKRIADEGPTQQELDNAKSYLTGSFALRFDSNAKIANQLLWFWMEDLGIDYVDRRNSEIEAVTLADLKRVARRLFEKGDLIVTIAGRPKISALAADGSAQNRGPPALGGRGNSR
ncbi:MAG TPA: pitrilysin family protein [Hyphomicrobiaceae bacterium]|nr:pitrilysin family protein [Hyphomicrobiaceae bacterium]